jgi:hypothetical protein
MRQPPNQWHKSQETYNRQSRHRGLAATLIAVPANRWGRNELTNALMYL